jgi:glycosyltransferase involved in cell wall biosynthesis
MSDPFERPPIAQAPLSVILPVDNGEAWLEKVLGNWFAYLDTLGRDYEVLVVNDGNADGTAALAASLATKQPRLRHLQHPSPQGIGACLRTGLGTARFPLLFYTECSNSYQPADLGQLLEVIDKVDLVSGQRIRPSARERGSFWSHYAYRALLRCLFGLRLKDVDCPFKLFRRSIFARIPIQSDGPFVHAEILAKANFLGCIMTEVPVRYQPNTGTDQAPRSPGAWRADAFRVFCHPGFGPADSPEQPASTSVVETNL